jgi:hypothetical protein
MCTLYTLYSLDRKQENSHQGESKENLGNIVFVYFVETTFSYVTNTVTYIPNPTGTPTHTGPDKNERILNFYLTGVAVFFFQQLLFYFMMFKGSMCTAVLIG